MIEKSKNILPIFISFLIFNFIFADPPNWDSDGDGVIDNYTDFANSGSVTGSVLINGIEVAELGDMVGAFVGEELRGVGLAEVVPEALGGGYSFNILVYSNEAQGEMITFKFYYSSIDLVIDLNESVEFISDMVVGNVLFPQLLTGSYEEVYGCLDEIACNYDSEATNDDGSCLYYDCIGECGGVNFNCPETPVNSQDWAYVGEFNNHYYYLSNSYDYWIGSDSLAQENFGYLVTINDINEQIFVADILINHEQDIWFGLFQNLNSSNYSEPDGGWEWSNSEPLNYINWHDGEPNNSGGYENHGILSFAWDGDWNDTANLLGVAKSLLEFEPYGCNDETACNYNEYAYQNDASCTYSEENYDCDGNCASDVDCLGECGGLAIVDECGECAGDGIDDGACDCVGNVEDCAGECAGGAIVDECGVCDGGNADNLGCGCFEDAPSGCDNTCGSILEFDECGECGGNGIDNGACDCAGNVEDCAGECDGDAVIDECGECGGGNSGECESVSYNIPVHIGANLISFYSLPVANSVSEILYPNTQDFIFSVLGESMIAVNTGNNNWSGSLTNFYLEDGYWIRTLNATDIFINQAYQTEISPYNLHAGANLISYPSNTSILLEDALPDSLESNFVSILGEGVSAVRLEDGSWTGSLQYFESNKGYWFIIDEAMEFAYNLDQALPRNFVIEENNKMHIQSSQQAFYYINNLEELPLDANDWIIVENNGAISGSRFMNNFNKDIPVMGDDLSDYSQGYCKAGDFPSFKILKSDNTVINLFGEIPTWENMGVYVIDLFAFTPNSNHPLQIDVIEMFPNPFNPIINIDFNINVNGNIKVDIFDINGRFVSSIVDNQLSSGNHKFIWNADNYNSGIYFIRISSQTESIIKKITLIK